MITGSRIPHTTTVAVLMGGWSAERDVSLSSGESCFGALKRAGFNAIMVDVKRETIHSVLMDMKPDVAFNALHGKWGEGGGASAMLETLRIPYTHSGILASSVALNKEMAKIIFNEFPLRKLNVQFISYLKIYQFRSVFLKEEMKLQTVLLWQDLLFS